VVVEASEGYEALWRVRAEGVFDLISSRAPRSTRSLEAHPSLRSSRALESRRPKDPDDGDKG